MSDWDRIGLGFVSGLAPVAPFAGCTQAANGAACERVESAPRDHAGRRTSEPKNELSHACTLHSSLRPQRASGAGCGVDGLTQARHNARRCGFTLRYCAADRCVMTSNPYLLLYIAMGRYGL